MFFLSYKRLFIGRSYPKSRLFDYENIIVAAAGTREDTCGERGWCEDPEVRLHQRDLGL